MTDQQALFVDEYTKDCVGAKAAVRAGYEKKSARQRAYELLQNPEIKEAIKEKLAERMMSSEEASKRVSDIAGSRINDYMIPKKVLEPVLVRKKLSILIEEQRRLIEMKQEVFDRWTGGSFDYKSDYDEDEDDVSAKKEGPLDTFWKEQQFRKLELLEMEVELELNPKAYRDVKELQYVEKIVVDLVALAKAYGKGAVKKLGFNEHGPQVELYPADKALETILTMHGKLVKKHEIDAGGTFLDFLQRVNQQ
jgi:hypothetical protein